MLMKVENEKARQFYLEECVKSAWSTRQLERQINSFFYERLLSSQDKKGVAAEISFGIGERLFLCGQTKAIYI